MGFNCHGLVIGNEALFTKIPSYREGLTGMDLVRLVLERCSTSREGKETIIYLLNKYGQGGNCGFTSKFYYHSSFLLVDSKEGWIIETVGKEYAAKKIIKGIDTISNIISFGNIQTFDEYSNNLIEQAIENRWCHSIEDFHFQKCYSGFSFYPKEFYNAFIKTHFASGQIRQHRSKDLIENLSKKSNEKSFQFTLIDMFNVLRDHQYSRNSPSNGLTNVDICMHAGFGPIKFNQTTGSLVSVIPTSNNSIPVHYLVSESIPPSFISSSNNSISNPSLTYSSNNIWWKSEIINRNIIKYYNKLIKKIQFEINKLEYDIVCQSKILLSRDISQEQRNNLTLLYFHKADQLTNEWFRRAYKLSFEIESELSLCQELTWKQWRISANIPYYLIKYSKVEFDIKNYIALYFLLLILFLFNQFYFIIIFSLFIIYLLLIKIIPKKTKTKEKDQHIKLERLNFNDEN
ncbi:unnamed protein product [Rotaria sp. Silwood1]|nr:unnamed protein product [Rotaria sp. Silwood1]CAF1605700.1 unnamed protein product [Rotaria sp. Silwood1]